MVFVIQMKYVYCYVEIEIMCRVWKNFVIQIRFAMTGSKDVKQGVARPLASLSGLAPA